jgi:hypothetical protein
MASWPAQIAFKVVNDSGQTEGSGQRKFISTSRALVEAIGLWLAIWLFTAPLIFIPLIHLTAFPVGLIGGIVLPIFIFRRRRGKLDVKDARGSCPKCQEPLKIDLQNIAKETHWGVCLACKTGFSVPILTQNT